MGQLVCAYDFEGRLLSFLENNRGPFVRILNYKESRGRGDLDESFSAKDILKTINNLLIQMKYDDKNT